MNHIFDGQGMESLDMQVYIGNCTLFNTKHYNSQPVVIIGFTTGQKSNLTVLGR